MDLNLNSQTKVVLTDHGAKIYREHLHSVSGGRYIAATSAGFILNGPLWDIMAIFTPHMGLGIPVPFRYNSISVEPL